MFTATTFYRICITLVGAVSVRGDCWIRPDENGRVVIPKGTDTIPADAFYGCAALKQVKIPDSVENIGYGAFESTVNLKRVIFQKGSRLKGIGDYLFYKCFNLKRINFPASVKEIGAFAFSYSGLEKVIFKKGSKLKTIGKRAFEGSENLLVILPASVTKIGVKAFAHSSLKKIIFKKGSKLETIGESVSVHLLLFPNEPRLPQYESYCVPLIYSQAFYGSEDLKTINIPRGVVIKEQAFEDTGCPDDIFTPGAKIVDCIAKTKGLRGN